jgi:hypothetical protein
MVGGCSEDGRLEWSFSVSQNSGFPSARFPLKNAGPEKPLAVFGFEARFPTPATVLRQRVKLCGRGNAGVFL